MQDKTTQNTNSQPWYKLPIMWLVVGIPLSSVILGIILLTLAINTDDSMVVDDYYKKGKQINRQLARDHYAASLGLSATLNYDNNSGKITIKLQGRGPVNSDATNNNPITLRFLHPTRSKRDLSVTALREGDSDLYTAQTVANRTGRWYIQLETKRWRIIGEARFPINKEFKLNPAKL